MNLTLCVLDCMYGRPAEGIAVRLERRICGQLGETTEQRTDNKGQVRAWQPVPIVTHGIYRLACDIDSYFTTIGVTPLFPRITTEFRVLDLAREYRILITTTTLALTRRCDRHSRCRQPQTLTGLEGSWYGSLSGTGHSADHGPILSHVVRQATRPTFLNSASSSI